MIKRNFHPKIGMKVMIEKNIDGLSVDEIRNPQTIESFMKVPVDDVEDGYVYSIDLEGIVYLFDEFDLKPI